MKRLIALMMCAVSLGAAAQFPNLPYNPDENGDGLIGVVDLQGLLAEYGSEFSLLSSDNEVAMTRLPDQTLIECRNSCNSLPTSWHILDSDAAALHLDALNELVELNSYDRFWTGANGMANFLFTVGGGRTIGGANESPSPNNSYGCICYVKQRPKVEFFTCTASCSAGIEALDECVNTKASQGWYPMEQNQQQVISTCFWQPMWRWAE